MSEIRRVWSETFVGSYASTSGLALNYLAIPLVTRALGVRGYGVYGAAVEWIMLFATLLHLSLGQVIIHSLSRNNRTERYSTLFGTALALTAILSLLGAAALVALWVLGTHRIFGEIPFLVVLVLLPSLTTQIWYTLSQGMFQAIGRVQVFYYLTFLNGALNTLGIVVFLGFLRQGIWAAIAIFVVTGLIRTALSIRLLRRSTDGAIRPRFEAMRRMVRSGAAIHLTAIGYYIFNSSDLLIVNRFSGADEASWYKLAMLVFTGFVLVPAAMTSSLYSLGARLGPDAAWPAQRRVILQLLGFMTVVVAVAYPFWPRIVYLVAGPGFEPAAPLVRILLFGIWGMMASTLLSSQWILRGFFWQASLLTISVAALNIGLDFWAIPKWGAVGAAWVKVVSFGIIAAQSWVASLFVFGPRSRRAAGSAQGLISAAYPR